MAIMDITNAPSWTPRKRVYAIWAAIVAVGFTGTQLYQDPNINGLWLVLSIVGFVSMYRLMPLSVPRMRSIYGVWVATVVFGLIISSLAFKIEFFYGIAPYLGGFWLMLMGAGFIGNGLVDSPSKHYYAMGALQIAIGALCIVIPALVGVQYVAAAVVGTLAMVWLLLFR
jgi:hypothetical protein